MRARLAEKVLFQTAIVLLLGLGLAVAANWLRPQGLPWAEDWSAIKAAAVPEGDSISAKEAMAMHAKPDVVFIDARSIEAFAHGHIPGAMSLPYDPFAMDLSERIARLPSDKTFIVYCDGIGCPLSSDLAQLMRLDGVKRVFVLSEGLGGWIAADGEVR